jgi:hypothetical protein
MLWFRCECLVGWALERVLEMALAIKCVQMCMVLGACLRYAH